jgi:hypothetical protein
MTYPAGLFVPTVVSDDPGGTEILATHHNTQDTEILAIETELGTDVAGSKTNLKTRLAISLADDGTLEFADSSVLTIASGAITVTQNWHRVATEGGGATDDLVTINGLANDGAFLLLRPSTSNDIVLKHGTGNISCVSGADITLSDTNTFAILIYDANLTAWIAGALAGVGSLTTSAGAADSYVAVYTAAGNIEGGDDLQWNATRLTIGDGTAGRDYEIFINGEDNDCLIKWLEDESILTINKSLKIDDASIRLNDLQSLYFGTDLDCSIKFMGANGTWITPDLNGSGFLWIVTDQADGLYIGGGAAGVDYLVKFYGEDSQGIIRWMEDEDHFKFEDTLKTDAGRIRKYAVKDADYTAGAADEVIIANKGSAITITLPAATATGRMYIIKNIGAGDCTVDGNGAETIDGAATQTLNQWESIEIVDYASGAWIITSSHGTI